MKGWSCAEPFSLLVFSTPLFASTGSGWLCVQHDLPSVTVLVELPEVSIVPLFRESQELFHCQCFATLATPWIFDLVTTGSYVLGLSRKCFGEVCCCDHVVI